MTTTFEPLVEVDLTPVQQRVANGARWLDENFPGWDKRIDIGNLELSDGQYCICGQVFEEIAEGLSEDDGWGGTKDGFEYAYDHLFEQANSWISALVPHDDPERAMRVGQLLGFIESFDFKSQTTIYFTMLQEAWTELLEARQESW